MKWKELIDVKLEEWALIISTVVIVLLVFLQVLARYIFDISIGWSSELSRYLLIWITWVSASYAIRMREHIRITTVVNLFPAALKKIVEVFVVIVWFAFALAMAIEGTKVVMAIQMMNQTSSILGWPMWVVYLILPIGGVLMMIRLIQQLYFIFSGKITDGGESV